MSENDTIVSIERMRKIQLFQDLFYYLFCEDSIDGTSFDVDFLRAISSLREKYRVSSGEKILHKDELILVLDGKVCAVKIDKTSHDFMLAVLRRLAEVYKLSSAEALKYLADLGAKNTPRFTPEWMK